MRSVSSLKQVVRLCPRWMTWSATSGTTYRACLGIGRNNGPRVARLTEFGLRPRIGSGSVPELGFAPVEAVVLRREADPGGRAVERRGEALAHEVGLVVLL